MRFPGTFSLYLLTITSVTYARPRLRLSALSTAKTTKPKQKETVARSRNRLTVATTEVLSELDDFGHVLRFARRKAVGTNEDKGESTEGSTEKKTDDKKTSTKGDKNDKNESEKKTGEKKEKKNEKAPTATAPTPPSLSQPSLLKRSFQRLFHAIDTNNDNHITVYDITREKWPQILFRFADLNGDKKLSKNEILITRHNLMQVREEMGATFGPIGDTIDVFAQRMLQMVLDHINQTKSKLEQS